MIEARPMLEYRAAADDRRQRTGFKAGMILRIVLVPLLILVGYIFLLGLLGGVATMVASLVSWDLQMFLLASGCFVVSTVCFLLILFCARVWR
jgi:hypothetical protein